MNIFYINLDKRQRKQIRHLSLLHESGAPPSSTDQASHFPSLGLIMQPWWEYGLIQKLVD